MRRNKHAALPYIRVSCNAAVVGHNPNRQPGIARGTHGSGLTPAVNYKSLSARLRRRNCESRVHTGLIRVGYKCSTTDCEVVETDSGKLRNGSPDEGVVLCHWSQGIHSTLAVAQTVEVRPAVQPARQLLAPVSHFLGNHVCAVCLALSTGAARLSP